MKKELGDCTSLFNLYVRASTSELGCSRSTGIFNSLCILLAVNCIRKIVSVSTGHKDKEEEIKSVRKLYRFKKDENSRDNIQNVWRRQTICDILDKNL